MTLSRLLLFLEFFLAVNATSIRWLVMDLHSFHITHSCLSDICRNPRFKNTLKVGDILISSSIQINSSSTNGVYDRIVSAPLKPTHIESFSVFSEIVGTDPTFNFARTCDNSSSEHISKLINQTIHERDSAELVLKGKCFHARVKISVHLKTCPWCVIDETSIISNEEEASFLSSYALLLVGCILSTLIALLAVIAFICACRLNRELATKLRRLDTSSSPSTQDTESHYDLPWKNYACRTRMVSVPYTPTKPIENLVCVSPSDHSNIDQSPFGVCLGTTHLYNRDERYVAIRNACEDSGRDSI